MDDIEKNRTEYVARLETTQNHLQAEHDKYKRLAETWEPIFTSGNVADGKVVFNLAIAGKQAHVTVTNEYLQDVDQISAITAIVESLTQYIVMDALKAKFTPEFLRMQKGAKGIAGAGKW